MSGQNFLTHINFVARKKWIERKKRKKKKEKFLLKKGRVEGNKRNREKRKGKINLLELNLFYG